MQTLQNGIEVPTNSDPYNLTDDLAGMGATSNVIIPVSTTAQRDALTDKFIGMTVRRLDFRGTLEWWDGSGWVSERGVAYTPIWTGVTDFGTGGSLTGTYWVDGDQVTVRAKAKFGLSATMGTGAVFCPLPPGYPIVGAESLTLGTGGHASGGDIRPLLVFAGSTTTASVWAPPIAADRRVVTPGDAGYPANNGDYMEISITYQTSAV